MKRKGLVWQELVYNICRSSVALFNYYHLGEVGGRHFHFRHWYTVLHLLNAQFFIQGLFLQSFVF